MAKNDIYKSYKSSKSKIITNRDKIDTKSKISKKEKEASNLQKRLKAGGVDVKTDTRNWFEKATNLPENQNFIFDLFDLINRPQEALFGAIKAGQEGEDIGKGAWDGFSGKQKTQFKEILNSDKSFNDREGKIDLVDVLGFAGDVLLDPMDLALIPVTMGGSAAAKAGVEGVEAGAKTLKAIDKTADVAKAASKVDNVVDTAKTLNKANDVVDIVNKTKKLSGNDIVFKGLGKGIKGGVKLTDNTITKALGALSDGGKTMNAAGKMLNYYNDAKDLVSTAFKYAKNIPAEKLAKYRKAEGDETVLRVALAKIKTEGDNSIREIATKISKETGENVDDIVKVLDKEVALLKGYEKYGNRTSLVSDIIKSAKKGKVKYTKEIKNALDDIASDFVDSGLDFSVKNNKGLLDLGSGWRRLKTSTDDFSFNLNGTIFNADIEKLTKEVKLGNFYGKEQPQQIKNLLKSKKYEKGLYKEAYDIYTREYTNAQKIIKDMTGFDINKTGNYDFRHAKIKGNEEMIDKILGENPSNNLKQNLKGKSRVLNSRKYDMSVEEANNLFGEALLDKRSKFEKLYKEGDEGAKEILDFIDNPENRKLFSDSMSSSFDAFMEDIPSYIKNSEQIDALMTDELTRVEKTIKDYNNRIKKAEEAGDELLAENLRETMKDELNDGVLIPLSKSDKVPTGYKEVDKDTVDAIVSKLNKMGNQLNSKELTKASKNLKDIGKKSRVVIDKQVINMLGLGSRQDTNAIVNMFDGILNFWKKSKTLSPTFQLNNILGNSTNMYLSGMRPDEIVNAYNKANNILKDAPKLMEKYMVDGGKGLSKIEINKIEDYIEFLNEGFGDLDVVFAGTELPADLAKYVTGKNKISDVLKNGTTKEKIGVILNAAPIINAKMNTGFDNLSKLAVFVHAKGNVKYLDNLGVATAGEAVRRAVFDPSELTEFEQKVMKRLVPFYTYTKKNLAYHIKNMPNNATRYKHLVKTYNDLWRGATGDETTVPDYLRENMYLPIGAADSAGNYQYLRTQVPFGNLIDTSHNLLDKGVLGSLAGLSNPLLQQAYEKATGVDIYTGRQLTNKKSNLMSNLPVLDRIPLTNKGENALSNLTGLDVPLKALNRLVGEGLSGTVTSEGNIYSDQLSQLYNEVNRLEETMKSYKAQGYEFSTINELKKANQNKTLSRINTILNKYK